MQSPENYQEAADLIQSLFGTLYRSLRNRGVEFKEESEVDIFTPNLSDEVITNIPSGMHVSRKQE